MAKRPRVTYYSDSSSAPTSEDDDNETNEKSLQEKLKIYDLISNDENTVFVKLSNFDRNVFNDVLYPIKQFEPIIYPESRIVVKLSEQEKLEAKRNYRREYKQRPHVIAKLEQAKLDPVLIEKKKLMEKILRF